MSHSRRLKIHERRNLRTMREATRGLNEQNLDLSVHALGSDTRWYVNNFEHPIVGREQGRQATAKMFRIFPDARFEPLQESAFGDRVQMLFRVVGHESRGFMGYPAKAGPFEYLRSVTVEFSRGGVAKNVWDVFDSLTILQQLGLLPASRAHQVSPVSAPAAPAAPDDRRSAAPPGSQALIDHLDPVDRYFFEQNTPAERHQVLSILGSVDAFNRGDYKGSVADFAPDIVVFEGDLKLVGRETLERAFRQIATEGPDRGAVYRPVRVFASGPLAATFSTATVPSPHGQTVFWNSVISEFDSSGMRKLYYSVRTRGLSADLLQRLRR